MEESSFYETEFSQEGDISSFFSNLPIQTPQLTSSLDCGLVAINGGASTQNIHALGFAEEANIFDALSTKSISCLSKHTSTLVAEKSSKLFFLDDIQSPVQRYRHEETLTSDHSFAYDSKKTTFCYSTNEFNRMMGGEVTIAGNKVYCSLSFATMFGLRGKDAPNDITPFNTSKTKKVKVHSDALNSNLSIHESQLSCQRPEIFIPSKSDFVIDGQQNKNTTTVLVKPNQKMNSVIDQCFKAIKGNTIGEKIKNDINKNFCKSVVGKLLGDALINRRDDKILADHLSYSQLAEYLSNKQGKFNDTPFQYEQFLNRFLDIIQNPAFNCIAEKRELKEERKKTYAIELTSLCLAFEKLIPQMQAGPFRITIKAGRTALPAGYHKGESGVGVISLRLERVEPKKTEIPKSLTVFSQISQEYSFPDSTISTEQLSMKVLGFGLQNNPEMVMEAEDYARQQNYSLFDEPLLYRNARDDMPSSLFSEKTGS